MSMTKEEVLEQFEEGYDCAQVVFHYWAEIIKDVQFREKFLEKYPSTMCSGLLKADFSTPEGSRKVREQKLMITFSPQLVADVLDVLDEIM